jgi:hypothetical protein
MNTTIERHVLDSSCLKSMGYATELQVLEVEFKGGQVYRYSGVSVELYEGFLMAESKGRFFHQFVRRLPFTRE